MNDIINTKEAAEKFRVASKEFADKICETPEKAREFLVSLGTHDKDGNITPEYGGKQLDMTDPKTPENTIIYVIGDIHGRADLLRKLQNTILDEIKQYSDKRKVLVYLGDYIDRGPESKQVINLVRNTLDGKVFDEVICLKGNHETFMLDHLNGQGDDYLWFINGGRETLKSYNDVIPESHKAFFNNLSLYHEEGGYLFVHAGIRPGISIEDQQENELLWIRELFLDSEVNHGKLIVHGHTIKKEPQIWYNRIGIDTGAYYYGVLTCLVLEDDDQRFIQVKI